MEGHSSNILMKEFEEIMIFLNNIERNDLFTNVLSSINPRLEKCLPIQSELYKKNYATPIYADLLFRKSFVPLRTGA
jgi:hypothetical protein